MDPRGILGGGGVEGFLDCDPESKTIFLDGRVGAHFKH